MARIFGATVPPSHGGSLPTSNSDTGYSDRYCIHYTSCGHYKKSKMNGNTVEFETPYLKDMEEYLSNFPKLPGGIQKCGICLR